MLVAAVFFICLLVVAGIIDVFRKLARGIATFSDTTQEQDEEQDEVEDGDNIEFVVDARKIYMHVKIKQGRFVFNKQLTVNDIDELVKQLKSEKRKMLS
jgi:hypothetical protein